MEKKPVTVVIEDAEIIKYNDNDDNVDFYKTYYTIKALLDSPLNKSGKLSVVVHTKKNSIILFDSRIEISENPEEFSGLMYYFSKKLLLKSEDGIVLAKYVKGPITDHLPPNAIVLEAKKSGENPDLEKLEELKDKFFILYISIGETKKDYSKRHIDIKLKFSNYCISPETVSFKATEMFESIYEIF